MTGTTFQRYEKKYMLTREQCTALMKYLKGRLQPDQYGSYTISNIYYDTDNFDLIRMSLEKPVYKEKLRMRWYGPPEAGNPVFLELKKKYDGVVYKRRAELSYDDAKQFMAGIPCGEGDTQIMKEIGYFLSVYPVKPKVFLCYDRVALAGTQDEGLRITFDTGIRFRQTSLSLNKGNWGTDLLDRDKILMEVKVPGAFPLWISRAFSELGIFPASFSKYGSCYTTHLADGLFKREVERSA